MDDPSTLVPSTLVVGDQDELPSSWHQLCPDLAVATILGVDQKTNDISHSFFPSFSVSLPFK